MKIVQIESEIPSARNDQRIQSARVLNNDEESTLVKSVYATASTDAEQLSASTDHLCPKAVRTVDVKPEVVHLLVRENLASDQCTDAELGRVVQLCLEDDERPTNESIQPDSELTKKMVVKWDNLEFYNELVYRRLNCPKPSKPTMLQLLVPRCCVPEVLRLCHTGTVGGHFGAKRTMIQVQHRFYWATWKTAVRKYCKACSECSTYHRGKLSRTALHLVRPR